MLEASLGFNFVNVTPAVHTTTNDKDEKDNPESLPCCTFSTEKYQYQDVKKSIDYA